MAWEISSGQRPRIADTGGAAVADEIEAERVEVLREPRLREIIGHHLRARRERGLDPGLHPQAALDRVLGEQPRGDHHRRVRRIGAGGDGGDHHVAVAEVEIPAFDRHAQRCLVALAVFLVEGLGEGGSGAGKRHAILRTLRSRDRRLDIAEVEMERLGEDGVRRIAVAIEPLRLRIGFDQRDAFARPRRRRKIGERLLIDGKEAARRAVFRRHIGDGGAVFERKMRKARSRRTPRTCRRRPHAAASR